MKKILLITICLFIKILSSTAYSQEVQGEIYGRIIDAVSKQPLVGANVILIGTTCSSAVSII
jgi:hypothetical protein